MMMGMWSVQREEKNQTNKHYTLALLTSLCRVKCFPVQSCKAAGRIGGPVCLFRCEYESRHVQSCVDHNHVEKTHRQLQKLSK